MRRLGYLFTLVGFAGLLVTAGGNAASTPLTAHQPAGPQNDSPIFVDSGQLLGEGNSSGVALGDLNGDGFTDAFVANALANEVWLNDGAGFFSSNGQALGESYSNGVALGDLDGDGDLDAVVATLVGDNQVWLNDSSGQFTAGAAFEPLSSYAVALGDVNGDGYLDAVFANEGPNRVWFNDGAGQFTDSDQAIGSASTLSVALADLNGDGHLDVVFGGGGGAMACLNNGGGIFQFQCQTFGPSGVNGVALGDLDGDGDVDAVLTACQGGTEVWLNDGNGNFSDSGQELGGEGCAGLVALADVTGNGALDAVIGHGSAGIRIWLNDGSGTLTLGQTLAEPGWTHLALADLDGDSDADLFAARFGPNLVYFNEAAEPPPPGEPFFVDSSQRLGITGSGVSVALGDLNDNGFMDAFVAHGADADRVWLNNGSGYFSSNGQALSGSFSQAVALGDLNGNGYLDAVVAVPFGSEGNRVWLNDGQAQFSAGAAFAGLNSSYVALGDVNGDGHLDAVFANNGPNRVWFNNGDATFTDSGQTLGTANSRGVALADLNGDGHLDAYFANSDGPDTVCLNDGSGTLEGQCQTLDNGDSQAVALGDLNGDGFIDAFVVACNAPNTVWLNDGSGSLSNSGQALGDHCSSSVALADLTGNGALGAIVASGSEGVHTWLNDGSGLFVGQTVSGLTARAVALADLDDDGDLDIYAARLGPDQVWFNFPGAPPPELGANLQVTVSDPVRYYQIHPDECDPCTETFTATITNLGPGLAVGVEVKTRETSPFTRSLIIGASQGSCPLVDCFSHWLLGPLAPGESATVQLRQPTTGLCPGDIIYKCGYSAVEVSHTHTDPVAANNRVELRLNYFWCFIEIGECVFDNIFCSPPDPAGTAAAGRGDSLLAGLLDSATDFVIDLAVYYLVRDGVLMGTADGQHYVNLYTAHTGEINGLLEADQDLKDGGIATLQLWEPNLWALALGRGDSAVITAGQVAAIDSFLTNLAAAASPELQQVIAAERARLGPPEDYLGMTMAEARGLIVGYGVRLPIVIRE
jgi:hypothetical protein